MAVQSEFHKDLSKFEPTYYKGLKKSTLKMFVSMLPVVALEIVEVIFVKGVAFWFLSLATGILFLFPIYLKYSGKWQTFKSDLSFRFKYQERYYEVGQIRRYERSEFIAKNKKVSETDII